MVWNLPRKAETHFYIFQQEQAKIAKLGLEMKLITSEMEAEADKWAEPDNAVVRRAKNMAAMAFSMYLFTRGEGRLHTTHDLFLQAEFFSEEGNKLYKTVKDFASRVSDCSCDMTWSFFCQKSR